MFVIWMLVVVLVLCICVNVVVFGLILLMVDYSVDVMSWIVEVMFFVCFVMFEEIVDVVVFLVNVFSVIG